MDDILKALTDLDSDGVTIEFVSRDLNRIPRFDPEELNLTFLLERVSSLEKKVREHDDVLTNHRVDILCIQDKHDQLQKKVDDIPKSDIVNDSENFDSKTNSVDSENESDPEDITHITKEGVKNVTGRESVVERRRHFSENDILNIKLNLKTDKADDFANAVLNEDSVKVLPIASNNHSVSRYADVVKNQNKEQNHSNAFTSRRSYGSRVFATASRTTTSFNRRPSSGSFARKGGRLQGANESVKELFLYRVQSGSEKEIIEYCRNKGIFVRHCSQVSHPDAKFK